jgi:hypothetical protein
MCDAIGMPPLERSNALQIGAAVLRARWPKVQAECIVWVGVNQLHAYVTMEWPGVVRVTLRHSGTLIAQSLPGRPFELDVAE